MTHGRPSIDRVTISPAWSYYRDGNGVAIEHHITRPRVPKKSDPPGTLPEVHVTETHYFSSLLAAFRYALDRDAQNATTLKGILPRMERLLTALDPK